MCLLLSQLSHVRPRLRAAKLLSAPALQRSEEFDAAIGVRGMITEEEEQLVRLERRFETREIHQALGAFLALAVCALAQIPYSSQALHHQESI